MQGLDCPVAQWIPFSKSVLFVPYGLLVCCATGLEGRVLRFPFHILRAEEPKPRLSAGKAGQMVRPPEAQDDPRA